MTDKSGIDDLEMLFREAAERPLRSGSALMARVLADAEAETRRRAPRAGFRAALAGWFGRGGAFAGLAAAALAGVWIGWAAPDPVQGMLLGDETVAAVELIPDLEEMIFASVDWD